MADIAKAIFDSCVTCWDRTADYRKYIRGLGDNLTALESKIHELGGAYSKVILLVETAEREGWMRKDDAGDWLVRVDKETEDCNKILSDGKEMMGRNCMCGLCIKDCRARYRQSKLAEAKKRDLEAKLDRGRTFRDRVDVAYEPADLILKRSLEDLRRTSYESQLVLETVKQRVKLEEEMHMVRTPDVGGWLVRVEDLLKQVPDILEKGELEMNRSCQSRRNCISCHRLSKDAQDKIPILEKELGKGRGFTTVAIKPNDPLILEIPLDKVVGLDSDIENVWKWVQDEKVSCIGLYGMGGVGKTTLLKKIHNEFLKAEHNYDSVAWIVVSRPANHEKIQHDIWRSLRLPESDWDRTTGTDDRASKILNALNGKRFLLFLDDIWEEINLTGLGIASHDHHHKSKIIFTTRSEAVCRLMKANKMEKVDCLPEDKALELFREKVGEATWSAHIKIPELAEAFVKECRCLPLALITVGRAMSAMTDPDDWRRAIDKLRSGTCNFPDMEPVLSMLEFSYDALPDEAHKKCFLYCSIFPEDREIGVGDLINLWIGEGLLDKYEDIHGARDRGIDIIGTLKRACLLEEDSTYPGFESIRMHDVVRDMALWVGAEHERENNKILVQDGLRSFQPKDSKKWNVAEMVSIWGWGVKQTINQNFAARLSCSKLSTLILRGTTVEALPSGFLLSMPSLRVLDLSQNDYLRELTDDIGALVKLRYLNLLSTGIGKLPIGTKSLINLVVLLVPRECVIPKGVISSLSSLKVFRWFKQVVNSDKGKEEDELDVIEELQGMSEIDEVGLDIDFDATIQKIVTSGPQLQRRLGELVIFIRWGLKELVISRPMEYLRRLDFYECGVEEIRAGEDGEYRCSERINGSIQPPGIRSQDFFRSLKTIDISYCSELRDVTVLIYHAPSLARLRIECCNSMRDVIAGDVDDSHVSRILSCLSILDLWNLQELESICRRALPFPSLNTLSVGYCRKLKKLPLDSSSASRVQIRGNREWWEELGWHDEPTKTLFSDKFDTFISE